MAKHKMSWEEVIYIVKVGIGIRRARQAANMTQQDLASKLGVTKFTIGLYERGDSRVSAFNLSRIAAITNTPIEQIINANNPHTKAEDHEQIYH
jgi:transcriptional regulator with XRE-family HTH domain